MNYLYLKNLEKNLVSCYSRNENSKLHMTNALATKRRKSWNQTTTGFQEGKSNRLAHCNVASWSNSSMTEVPIT